MCVTDAIKHKITQTLFPLNYTVISKSGDAQLDLLILDIIYKVIELSLCIKFDLFTFTLF